MTKLETRPEGGTSDTNQVNGKEFACRRSGKNISLADPHCADPARYCKWRTACPVHILEKEIARGRR